MDTLTSLFDEDIRPETQTISFPTIGECFTVESVNKQNQHISDAVSTILWGGATLLCNYMITVKDIFRHRPTLELGCGVGLPGILATKLGASFCCVSDSDDSPVFTELMEKNLHRNLHNISVAETSNQTTYTNCVFNKVVWNERTHLLPQLSSLFLQKPCSLCDESGQDPRQALDVVPKSLIVLCSDVIYYHTDVASLAHTIAFYLNKSKELTPPDEPKPVCIMCNLSARFAHAEEPFKEILESTGILLLRQWRADSDGVEAPEKKDDEVLTVYQSRYPYVFLEMSPT
ncbi:hypothetical protein BLNAU_8761 [Blattamonas nauphoetae]|uniref:Methyltransferase n=1 Tax=Blattamonas nauphoetae TaxID=2049346 RepID=A0ABQ9XXL2_9EUKA|nr:hypothetical protein BLNAU_8761 [Blattamonas nauphoetae]